MDDMKLTKEEISYLISLLDDKIESLRWEHASNGLKEFQRESVECLVIQSKLDRLRQETS